MHFHIANDKFHKQAPKGESDNSIFVRQHRPPKSCKTFKFVTKKDIEQCRDANYLDCAH